MRCASLSLRSVVSALSLALAACDDASGFEHAGDVALRPGGSWGCTLCSLNSPTVNDAIVTELHLDGQPNSTGVRLISVRDKSTNLNYRPDIDARDELLARNNANQVVFSGGQLAGKVLVLQTPTGPVELVIKAYDNTVPSWSTTGGPTTIYRMEYVDLSGVKQPLCPNTSDANKDMVTLINGETYDRVTNEIVPAQARWFTIACVAEGAFKMKMMDYHPAGRRQANLEQRRTTLRMITADYCGDGTNYTVDGTTVAWRNADGSVATSVVENALEAKWSPDGALCLDDPRYVDSASVHCSLPACDGDASFGPGVEWRTMLP